MRASKFAALTVISVATLASGGGCQEEGPAERAGKKVDEAVEEAGDKIEDAGDEIEDALDKK